MGVILALFHSIGMDPEVIVALKMWVNGLVISGAASSNKRGWICWLNASATTLRLLDQIQIKALRIIGVDEEQARLNLNIPALQHRRQVAAMTVLYKMHTSQCPSALKMMLPQPYIIRRTTRSSMSMPSHALTEPKSRTHSTGRRSFIRTAVTVWNSLPENIVGVINENGAQSFKKRVHKHLLQKTSSI